MPQISEYENCCPEPWGREGQSVGSCECYYWNLLPPEQSLMLGYREKTQDTKTSMLPEAIMTRRMPYSLFSWKFLVPPSEQPSPLPQRGALSNRGTDGLIADGSIWLSATGPILLVSSELSRSAWRDQKEKPLPAHQHLWTLGDSDQDRKVYGGQGRFARLFQAEGNQG